MLTHYAIILNVYDPNMNDYLYLKESENGNIQIWSWSSSVWPEIAPLFTISFQSLKKKKLAGLWLAGEVVNHVGIYGSKAAECLSAFQGQSCYAFR